MQFFVRAKLYAPFETEEERLLEYKIGASFAVNITTIRQLRKSTPFDTHMITAVLAMFKARDDDAFAAVGGLVENAQGDNHVVWRKSAYLSPDFYSALESGADVSAFIDTASISSMQRLYVVRKKISTPEIEWDLVVVDIQRRTVIYFDPREDYSVPDYTPTQSTKTLLENIDQLLGDFLRTNIQHPRGQAAVEWKCSVYKPIAVSFEPLQNNFDSGMYIYCLRFFLEQDCPLWFKMEQMELLRMNLCYAMLKGGLKI
jgi:hypothetical protein